MYGDIDNSQDIIDVRDIIERLEELRDIEFSDREEDEKQELVDLEGLLIELRDGGGDHQWEGSWYPVTLIRDSYFEDYARELAEDIGAIDANAGWPLYCIDWERAANDLRIDYTSVEYDGITYWYR